MSADRLRPMTGAGRPAAWMPSVLAAIGSDSSRTTSIRTGNESPAESLQRSCRRSCRARLFSTSAAGAVSFHSARIARRRQQVISVDVDADAVAATSRLHSRAGSPVKLERSSIGRSLIRR